MRSFLLVLVSTFSAFACQSNSKSDLRQGIDPLPEYRAGTDTREAFAESLSLESNKGSLRHLVVKRAALDKEYLMSASIIPQTGAPTSQGLQSRVVYFKLHHSRLFLMEGTQGRVVTDELPAQLILAELPIVSQDSRGLTVDFDAGMKKTFTLGNWYTSDYKGKEAPPEPFAVAKVQNSFIDQIKVSSRGMEIRQIAQLDVSKIKKGALLELSPTVEVRYFISPYHPNTSYQPKETSDFKWVGFFEVEPVLEKNSGRSITRISKFDTQMPITYYYSANTPPEYESAIKEGILYWNKAFGREVLKAEKAPVGITAPSIDHNLIQWVPWDQAGFAYADALMDPRSGEILRAQVYLTSAFAFGGVSRARRLLRTLKDSAEEAQASDHRVPVVGMSFASHSHLCMYDLNQKLVATLTSALASGADDETLKRISEDYVRFVAAHEVGHTLGLRHNFAASLTSELSLDERDEVFKNYLQENQFDLGEKRLVNSVMEYAVFAEDILTGKSLVTRQKALEYDEEALHWAYFGRALKKEEKLLFCTDSQVDTYIDCNRFDAGKHLANASHDLAELARMMPRDLVESFINAKSPMVPHFKKPLEEVALNPEALVNTWMDSYEESLAHFIKDKRSLWIERRFPFVSSLNEEDIIDARFEQLNKDLKALGGIEEVIFKWMPGMNLTDPELAKTAEKELEEYLERPEVQKGVGPGGPYEFSPAELKLIAERGKLYFEYVEDYLLEARLEHVAKLKFEHEESLYLIEDRLASLAEAILFEEEEVNPPQFVEGVELPTYWYEEEIRQAAVALLAPDRGDLVDFAADHRARLKKKLSDQIKSVLGKKFEDTKTPDLPRKIRQWKMNQEKLLAKL